MALLTQPLVTSVQMTKHKKLLISKHLDFSFPSGHESHPYWTRKNICGIPPKRCNGQFRTSAKAGDVTQWQNPGLVGWTMGSVPRATEINTYQGVEYEPGSQNHIEKKSQCPSLKQRGVRSGLVHWALSLLWPTYGSWLKSIVTISKSKHHTVISLKTWSHTWNVMPSFTQFANQGSLRPRERNKMLTSKLPKRTGLGFRKTTRNKKSAF